MMYNVTAKMIGVPFDEKKILGRENAEAWAEMAYGCDNVYAVEITNTDTGELIWYKSKD